MAKHIFSTIQRNRDKTEKARRNKTLYSAVECVCYKNVGTVDIENRAVISAQGFPFSISTSYPFYANQVSVGEI